MRKFRFTQLREGSMAGWANGTQNLGTAFPALMADGLGFIDVGSRGGFHPMVQEIGPLVDLVGFEPDADECDRLNQQVGLVPGVRSVRHIPCALGRADGSRVLHVCRRAGTSSFYMPDRALLNRFPDAGRFDVVSTVEIPTRSLDRMQGTGTDGLPRQIDFLKIDTQGAELDVLSGAERILRTQAVGVEVEVAFARLYESQPLFRDVDALLSARGFTLFKLRRYSWTRRAVARASASAGQMVFADALYLKDPLAQRGLAAQLHTPHQLEALVVMATLFDLHDVALEVLGDSSLSRRLNAEAARDYVIRRSQRISRNTPRRIARAALSGLRACWENGGDLKYLLPLLRRHHRSWARGDSDFYTQL